MDAATVRVRGLDYSIECAVCLEPMTNDDAYAPICEGNPRQATSPDAHARCHYECLEKHFNRIKEEAAKPENAEKSILLTCPVDGSNMQMKNGGPLLGHDTPLSRKIAEYVRNHPEVLKATSTPAVVVDSHFHHQPIPRASERSYPPALSIAAGLFLLSAIAYAVNHLCFAGASAILAVIGFPASLVIIPLVYLLQQVIQLIIAAAQIITAV